MMDFEAKCITSARKEHVCFGCREKIAVGSPYIAYPCSGEDGKFRSIKICPTCGFLLMQKNGANASTLREGEFSEVLIPNCLRKKRNAYWKDPKKAIHEAGMDTPVMPEKPRQIARIVVKKTEFHRAIFFLPKKKLTPEHFSKGNTLTIQAGVAGKSRSTIVNGAWLIDGKNIGRQGKFVAVLTKGEPRAESREPRAETGDGRRETENGKREG